MRLSALLFPPREPGPVPGSLVGTAAVPVPDFETLYQAQFDFIWRSLRRLGVLDAALDDALQDVFMVVHRRLGEFRGDSRLETWLFGIALRVACDYRKRARRAPLDSLPELLADHRPKPDEQLLKSESVELLYALLEELDEDKRAVFILAELEQMTMPEISQATGTNVNTVAARLRAARREFEQAAHRRRVRDEWRSR